MKKNHLIVFMFVTVIFILISGCGSSSDNDSGNPHTESEVNNVLSSFRAYTPGVDDHYYEFEKLLIDGNLVTTITRYTMQEDSSRVQDWKTTMTPVQSKSIHVTGSLINGEELYLVGYYTLSMDGILSNLVVNSRANGFLVKASLSDGKVLGSIAFQTQTGVWKSTVIPLSIGFEGDDIQIIGKSTGGIAADDIHLEPESILDQFTIIINPDSGQVISAFLTPGIAEEPFATAESLGSPPEYGEDVFDNNEKTIERQAESSSSGLGEFLGNFEANAFASWSQSKVLSLIFPKPSVNEQLGKITNQMNEMQNELKEIQNKLDNILGGFSKLYHQILEESIKEKTIFAHYFADNIQGYWNQFYNAVDSVDHGKIDKVTLEMFIEDEAAAAMFSQNFGETAGGGPISNMNSNLNALFKLAHTSTANVKAGLIPDLYEEITAKIQESNYGSKNFDLETMLNGYNESMMNIYACLVQATQINYVIFSAYVWLADKYPEKFGAWTFPIQRVSASYSAGENQKQLNEHFKGKFQEAFNSVAWHLISDKWAYVTYPESNTADTITYIKPDFPRAAKLLKGMPKNLEKSCGKVRPWTNACDIYVWKGAGAGFSGFCGEYRNNSLRVRCSAGNDREEVTFDLRGVSSSDKEHKLQYYFNSSGLNGKEISLIQPEKWNDEYLKELYKDTVYTGSHGYAQIRVAKGYEGWSGYIELNSLLSG